MKTTFSALLAFAMTFATNALPSALSAQEEDVRIPSEEKPTNSEFVDYDSKLLLTNAVSAIDGASGGGISNWATIAGRQEAHRVGFQAHVTAVILPEAERALRAACGDAPIYVVGSPESSARFNTQYPPSIPPPPPPAP